MTDSSINTLKVKVTLVQTNGALSRITLEEAPHFQCIGAPIEWLDAYFKNGTLPPLHWPDLPLFTRQTIEKLRSIPMGQTLTYSDLGPARAVGNAMNRNPFPLLFPCHRIVAKGGLGGFAFGQGLKQVLLKFETSA